jgi:hypothetical protein
MADANTATARLGVEVVQVIDAARVEGARG